MQGDGLPRQLGPWIATFFFNEQGLDPKVLTAAKMTAKALGATVVRTAAGSMLLEAPPTKVAQVAKACQALQCRDQDPPHP